MTDYPTYTIVVINDEALYRIDYTADAVTVAREDVTLLSSEYLALLAEEHDLADDAAVLAYLGISVPDDEVLYG